MNAGLITHECLRLYPEPKSIKKKLYFESGDVIDGTLRFKSKTPLNKRVSVDKIRYTSGPLEYPNPDRTQTEKFIATIKRL